MAHTYARVVGFGVAVTPLPPFSADLIKSPAGTVDIEVVRHLRDGSERRAVFSGSDDGSTVPAGADSAIPVADVLPVPYQSHWLIQTSQYSIPWPTGFTLESPPPGESPPFLLWGQESELIFIQGPVSGDELAPLYSLATPGQTVVSHASTPEMESVEFAYQHEGVAWRQILVKTAHAAGAFVVVTGQAPASRSEWMGKAVAEMASGLLVDN
ncbi:hypothetical protein P3T36_007154 [Kitasatospora sp. MAP12-15]|uniref:hypothetical protein n=1 Tax=unclassified Kitasatospora TaxID=2633591 RepID=UPI0024743AE7|nr:hypothetical protein [Kitasatospora sp. MAP12-44]MDH6108975.1 hypothetical protein [Kitasatospora sp. MAP12-44]